MKHLGFFTLMLIAGALSTGAANTATFTSFSYTGNEDYYRENPLTSPDQTYNPILPGWYSDPSICRVGPDYYLVTSTFGYYPGVPIFHSTDLVNWEQIGNVLDRPSQADFSGQSIDKGGIYAPQISYNPATGTYYMITTDYGDGRGKHFYVTTSDPRRGWSDPVWIEGIDGIDPSLFFDEDGKTYIIYKEDTTGQPKWSNFRAIRIAEFDPAAGKVVGEKHKFLEEGVGPEEKLGRDEGPHIYKVDGKYILICAEGGTGIFHSEVCYKADSIFGPYTRWSRNPMLTQRELKPGRTNPVTCSGHVDMFQTPEGEWYGVFLGCRPIKNDAQSLGRETFIMPVHWSRDGFPYITQEKDTVPMTVTVPGAVRRADSPIGNFTWTDDFSSEKLRPEWMSLRGPADHLYKLGKGLELTPSKELATGKGTPAYIGRRMQHHKFDASVALDFHPKAEGERAGLLIFKNEGRQYFMALGRDGLTLRKIGKGKAETVAQKDVKGGRLELKIVSNGPTYDFLYRRAGTKEWQTLATGVDAAWTSDSAGGFTGTTFGPYAEIR